MELATCSDDLETAPGNLPADSPTFYHNITELPLVDTPLEAAMQGLVEPRVSPDLKGTETTVGLSKKGVVARGCEVPGVEVAL